MRRILCLLLATLSLFSFALAENKIASLEDMALSEMTLSELYGLRSRVNEQIEVLEESGQYPSYESGTYHVGVDMPEGVYLLMEDGTALLPSVLIRLYDEAAGKEGTLEYELVLSSAVMRFSAGSYITLADVTAYPFDQAPEIKLNEAGMVAEGGYWIGQQIPAGNYLLVPEERAPLPSYSIYADVPGSDADPLEFDTTSESIELTLEDGQYISLSGCSLQWIPET